MMRGVNSFDPVAVVFGKFRESCKQNSAHTHPLLAGKTPQTVVYNHWTGMVEWNGGMECVLWGERSLLMHFSIKVLQLKYKQ